MHIDAATLPFDCDSPTNRESCTDVASAALPEDLFATVVANAPLVSIDLIMEDPHGRILLGLRTNPPAKGYWFVPGGRVRKNETLDAAFVRIARNETGLQTQRSIHPLTGVYEHFYDMNFAGTENASTHYVVLAHRLRVIPHLLRLAPEQHSRYQWMHPDEIVRHPDVHPYTRAYFELT